MNMPKFSAEASLRNTHEHYQQQSHSSISKLSNSQVIPSQLPPGCTMVEECWPFFFGPFCDTYMVCRRP